MDFRAGFLAVFLLLFTASATSANTAGLGFSVSGRWTVRVSIVGGRVFGVAELTQNGSHVTGWLEPNGGDRTPMSGVLLSDSLILTTHPESRHLVAFDRCEVKATGNHMKGTFYPGNGKIEFIREREPRILSRPRDWHWLNTGRTER